MGTLGSVVSRLLSLAQGLHMLAPHERRTYETIRDRLLAFRPQIRIDNHIDFNHVDGNGVPTFSAESTTLGGINFRAKNFERLRREFRNARNSIGEPAFDYFPLRPDKIRHFFRSAFTLNLLDLSYLATRGFGFREIWNPLRLDDRPLSIKAAGLGRTPSLFDERFGARFGEAGMGERRQDTTALHAALLDDRCNIHIDDIGFVMRGLGGGAGMTPDFGQHLVDELLWKDILAPWIWKQLGERVSINLPSSRTGYVPSVGLTLDLPDPGLSLSATFTFKCKCLSGGRTEIDAIPEGYSFGIGLKKEF